MASSNIDRKRAMLKIRPICLLIIERFYFKSRKKINDSKSYELKPNLAFIAFLTALVSNSEPAVLPANVSEQGSSDAPVTLLF